ncbi:hypothetical protein CY34DRAFT_811956 [Suillus luteus UH-Slu-Lm8-n1]|uniref:Uncharacterized protein n=1 Tax=Suillus luteus UH-Slu-Lm8-n1 TaxID=930992 RepID=A0A0D0AC54_9AGAM|nr:hypothetical protein CY34DRAFT_811956 [Suillus luteus UH-Slu-Lm8-n1]
MATSSQSSSSSQRALTLVFASTCYKYPCLRFTSRWLLKKFITQAPDADVHLSLRSETKTGYMAPAPE